jgi:hypothetical protein
MLSPNSIWRCPLRPQFDKDCGLFASRGHPLQLEQ